MRRLLMVAYHFPPVGGVGVERTLKHATYLPDHGWQPVVMAPSSSAYRIVDPTSTGRIPPDVEVHRAPTLEPAHLRRALGSLRRGKRAMPGPASDGDAAASASAESAGARLRRQANAAWAAVIPKVFFPDDHLLWAPSAVIAATRLHRRSPVDAVYSSSPPVSGHLAALVLAHHLRLPWIADFRDPWIGNAFAPELPGVHRALQRHLERAIVERADRVLFATKMWRDRYLHRYPTSGDRFVHVPNGYDRSELGAPQARTMRAGEPFRLIHPGSIYGDRELDLLLDGLALALERDPSLRERLRIELIGWLSARNRAVANDRRRAFDPVLKLLDFRPRPEVLAMERSADAGLILIADYPGRDADVNAKLYEYLGLDLPVLAVAPRGETRTTLEELGWGIGADPTPEGVADGLAAMLATPRPAAPADPDGRYDRRALTEQLVAELDRITR